MNQIQIQTSAVLDQSVYRLHPPQADYNFLKNFKFKNFGSQNYSNTPDKIVFVRKHKCGSSTAVQLFQNFLKWKGLHNEIGYFLQFPEKNFSRKNLAKIPKY